MGNTEGSPWSKARAADSSCVPIRVSREAGSDEARSSEPEKPASPIRFAGVGVGFPSDPAGSLRVSVSVPEVLSPRVSSRSGSEAGVGTGSPGDVSVVSRSASFAAAGKLGVFSSAFGTGSETTAPPPTLFSSSLLLPFLLSCSFSFLASRAPSTFACKSDLKSRSDGIFFSFFFAAAKLALRSDSTCSAVSCATRAASNASVTHVLLAVRVTLVWRNTCRSNCSNTP